jgi:Leucine-rich repeat (LRR) protein
MALYYGSTFCDAIFPETRSGEDILRDFFKTAGGQGWKDSSGWLSQSTPVCEWFGISCETNADLEEEVTEISLPSNSVSGRVPAIVLHLTSLRVLNVSGNPIDMSFRDASNAISLEQLDIRDTNIISVEGVGGASNLRVLKMSDNAFYGQAIPDEIFSLVQLTHLDVSRNGYAGELSSKVSQLTDLEVLDASRNDIAGTIPDEWENLPKMRQLDLSDNLLYGELPQSFSTLTALESLSISVRTRSVVGLSGQMPSFAALPNLRNIDLGSNALTGTIPANLLASVDPPSQAITVLLDSNQLHGELPIGLDRFTRLNIDLTDNEIDQIAPGLCEMTLWWGGDVGQHSCAAILCPAGQFNDRGRQDSEDNRCEDCPGEEASPYLGRTKCPSLQKAAAKKILEDLYEATGGANWKRRDNWLTHPDICVWHGITCKDELEVETVNLGSNNLSGRPPKELFELVGLRDLWLFSNPIEFSFEGIEKAETLSNLQLDSIGLSSLDGIGGALVLSYLDMRFNALEGPLSSELEKLTDLETLLISDNDFFGPLPSFASNRRLSTLKAGGNGFTGPLPSFSIHPNLRRLDVAGNQLNGEIPDDLLAGVDSTKPVLLFLAANKFSGILPGSLARFDDLTIFVSENEITGIHEDLCEQDKWNGGDVERFGCDAILCPPNTYGPANGRATSESGDCVPCSEADFFGHTICIGSGATREFSAAMSGIIFTVLTLSLFLDTW